MSNSVKAWLALLAILAAGLVVAAWCIEHPPQSARTHLHRAMQQDALSDTQARLRLPRTSRGGACHSDAECGSLACIQDVCREFPADHVPNG